MIVIVSSAATRYCFPPVLMTANIVCLVFKSGSDAGTRRPAFWQWTEFFRPLALYAGPNENRGETAAITGVSVVVQRRGVNAGGGVSSPSPPLRGEGRGEGQILRQSRRLVLHLVQQPSPGAADWQNGYIVKPKTVAAIPWRHLLRQFARDPMRAVDAHAGIRSERLDGISQIDQNQGLTTVGPHAHVMIFGTQREDRGMAKRHGELRAQRARRGHHARFRARWRAISGYAGLP